MSSEPKLVSMKAACFDLIAAILFFLFITNACESHIPVSKEPWHTILTFYTASCLTGVFWFAISMLRVTLADQLKRKG